MINPQYNNRQIAYWLLICAMFIISMIALGGATRLTNSGLSMVEWHPVSGIIPPLSEAAWQLEFSNYMNSPEYIYVNNGMSLGEFKGIFLLEYLHRALGRVVGVVFLLPLFYFRFTGQIDNKYSLRLLAIFCLGFLQGIMGWYMVKSGLVKDPHVSHFRLAFHLLMAALIYSLIIWEYFKYTVQHNIRDRKFRRLSTGLAAIVICQLFCGALVAGLKAGLVYNEFPLMGGEFIPRELYIVSVNGWLYNPEIVQFFHRIIAYIVTIYSLLLIKRLMELGCYRESKLLGAILFTQLVLGVLTLLAMVPVTLGVLHQLGGIALLTVVVYLIYCSEGS